MQGRRRCPIECSRRAAGPRLFEPLEPRLLLSGFTAYNDTIAGPLTHANATRYADYADNDSAGQLKDITTGELTGVHVSASGVGALHFGGTGANPSAGTEAADVFGGFVDFTSAYSENSVELLVGQSYTYTFSELDAGNTYEFAGTAVRGNVNYTNRWTLVTLIGADAFAASHSTGIGVVTAGLETNQVALWTGANHRGDEGFIAEWTGINPGEDGIFEVLSVQYTGPTPGVGTGTADGTKGYGLNGIRLIENEPTGAPAVINAPAANVHAFEAEIGGEITTTGGQAPNVTVYYGRSDGGINPSAWEHALDLGVQSGAFSDVVGQLTQGTPYYFRSFAENSIGSAWAPSTATFTTLTATPPSAINRPATSIGAFSASLGGEVTDTGNDPPVVTVYYGETDGGTSPGGWDGSVELDAQSGVFAAVAGGLEPETTYYFTAHAQNAIGATWAAPSLSFETTAPPPLQITEFMADNANTLQTRTRNSDGDPFVGDYDDPDWIEIHNPTDVTVFLDGYYLSDDLGVLANWPFPPGVSIEPGGFLVVFASGDDISDPALDENGYLHTDFGLKDDGDGEDVVLADEDGVVFAYENYPVQSEDVSYGIDAAGEERFYTFPTPGWDNADDTPRAPRFSIAGSTFTGSVVVELIAALPTDTIHYTLNESVPTAGSTEYTGPLTIADTTMVRAVSVGANGKSSVLVSETYIELAADVLDDSSNLPIVIVETFGDGVPSTSFGDSFIAIFEPGDDGRTHLADPFTLAARSGIHIRGSSSAGFAKKQYRIELWDEYNEDRKLEVLGMPSEADWILYGPSQFDRVLISNPFMYDLSDQIGRYAVRTRWVEVYLNANGGQVTAADYVGVYAVMEVLEQDDDRIDVEDLSSGAGGQPVEGGFIWKYDRGSAYVYPAADEITSAQRAYVDGYMSGFDAAAASADFADPELGYAAWIDVGSFLDNNLLNMLAMNVDAIRLSQYYFKTADGKLEAGPIWDFDRTLESTDGRDNNPERWYGTGDSTHVFDETRGGGWWADMYQDPDFVQAYIDRWFELRDGAFGLEDLFATIDAQAVQLQEAAPREYARWSASRYGDFAGEIQHLKDWLTARVNWIDSQWLDRPTSDVAEPVVTPGTGVMLSSAVGEVYYTLDGSDPRAPGGGAVRADGPVTIDAYTQITARVYLENHGPTNQGYIPSGDDWSPPTVIEYFVNPLVAAGDVVVTEINYHPCDATPAELATQSPTDPDFEDNDFEFIELRNVSGHPVNIRGTHFSNGVTLIFDSYVLADGERVVVVEDIAGFTARYPAGVPVVGTWSGELDNSGEKLALAGRDGSAVLDLKYSDSGPWPGRADGKGASLEIVDPAGDFSDPDNWRASAVYGGTPGAGPQDPLGVVVNEVLTHTDLPAVDAIELLNTTGEAIDIAGWYLSDSWGWDFSDSNGDYKKFQVPVLDLGQPGQTLLGPGEYIVFDEHDFNPTGLTPDTGDDDPNDFALSGAHGDDVWLMKADTAGNLTHFSDHAEFAAAANGVSFGRWPNGVGDVCPMTAVTLAALNSGPRFGPVVISEIQYYPGIFHENFLAPGGADRFTEAIGSWAVVDGRFGAVPAEGEQAVATIDLGQALWADYVLEADAIAAAATGGYDANAVLVFDYHSATDFKFAGAFVGGGQWRIGHSTAAGWIVDASVDATILADGSYELKLTVEGSAATLTVDGVEKVSHDFGEPLSDGLLGIGMNNSVASFGTVAVEPVGQSDLEFIELYNPTGDAVDLWESYFVDGQWRDYPWKLEGLEFATHTSIAAGEAMLVVSFDPAEMALLDAFKAQYGLAASAVQILGGYTGSLDNGGETIRLQSPDAPPMEEPNFTPYLLVDEVDYDDQLGGPDGNGESLHRLGAALWGNAAASWSPDPPTPGNVGHGEIELTDSSGDSGDAAVQFTTDLSTFRAGVSDCELVRQAYPDDRQYLDVTNVGAWSLTVEEIRIAAPDVTVDPPGDVVLQVGETQRFRLTYAPSQPTLSDATGQDFDLPAGLVIVNSGTDMPNLAVRLRGASTFGSDISYDGRVNLGELGILNANFGKNTSDADFDPTADINDDGAVNLGDLGLLNAELGRQVAAAAPMQTTPAAAKPTNSPAAPATASPTRDEEDTQDLAAVAAGMAAMGADATLPAEPVADAQVNTPKSDEDLAPTCETQPAIEVDPTSPPTVVPKDPVDVETSIDPIAVMVDSLDYSSKLETSVGQVDGSLGDILPG